MLHGRSFRNTMCHQGTNLTHFPRGLGDRHWIRMIKEQSDQIVFLCHINNTNPRTTVVNYGDEVFLIVTTRCCANMIPIWECRPWDKWS